MRSCSCEHELQLLLFHTVNNEPVAFDVDFSVAFPVADSLMIAVFRAGQLPVLSHERIDDSGRA